MAVILVIGASRGIGLELVREYAQAGWTVLATVRDAEAQARLQVLGARAFLVDVLKPESVTALATALAGQQIDLAMYVAGGSHRPHTSPRRSAGPPMPWPVPSRSPGGAHPPETPARSGANNAG